MSFSSPTHPGRPTRRAVLLSASGGLLATTSGVGCDFFGTDPAESESDGSQDEDLKEAPALREQVEAGELPPLQERLPENPLVVEPTERTGRYGGSWHTAIQGPGDNPWLFRTMGYESLMRWTPDASDVTPNIAESMEPSADGREFTVRLRRGMKWSDGEPFTTDDLVFSYEDVERNTEIMPALNSQLQLDGEPMELEQVDEATAIFRFHTANGLFILLNAVGSPLLWPKHYMRQFHIDYNPEVEEEADAEGYAGWQEYFLAMGENFWENADLPSLRPWVLQSDLGEEAGSQLRATRNPYYWKTDPNGAQLPYIDEIVYAIVNEEESILLNATNGELDLHTRHINTLDNKPVLARNRDEGDYRLLTLTNTYSNEMVIALNLAHEDPVKREVFNNKDFRIGLSYAINRQDLIDGVFQRQGTPWQVAPAEDSIFYDEEFATQYTEFDLDLANEHLDRAGYTERDGDGFRLGPEGERIRFNVEVATPALVPFWVPAMQQIKGTWAEVGIHIEIDNLDRTLWYDRKEANQHDANVWVGDGGLGDEMLEPRWYFPFNIESNFAIPWAQWYDSRGAEGAEPPQTPRRQQQLYDQLLTEPDEAAREELLREILAIAKEEFYVIGTVRVSEGYGIVSNDLHNVGDELPESAKFNTPALANPEQWYFDDA